MMFKHALREVDEYEGNVLTTNSGVLIDVFNPKPADIDIEDIAHALSNLCRFGGHCNEFFSVAEHSVDVSYLSENPLEGLLHDASEAYFIDLPRPIKNMFPEYRKAEKKMLEFILNKFKLTYPMSKDTKRADNDALRVEFKRLFAHGDRNFKPKSPKEAKELFLLRFNELTNNRYNYLPYNPL